MDKKYIFETHLLTFVLFLSSVVGLKVFGVSVNKIALLILEAYLIFKGIRNVKIKTGKILLLIWYIASIVSCILGFSWGLDAISGYKKNITFYAFQVIFMYIPCLFLSDGLVDRRKSFENAIVLVAKIHCIWAYLQFLSFYVLNLDLNSFIFNTLLHGVFGSEWSAWNAEAGSLALRIGGLNRDSAFFTLILIFGFASCKSFIWKCSFSLACLLSMSRAGIIGLVIVVIYGIIEVVKNDKVPRKLIELIVAVILLFICIYLFVPSINYQINYMIFRFTSIFFNTDTGTNRHLTYIWGSIQSWLFDYSPLQMLFGIGPRAGGIGLQLNADVSNILGYETSVWAVESDYCELLLGHGIFGYLIFFVYYLIYLNGTSADKRIVTVLLVMSLLYNYSELTMIQIWIICSLDYSSVKKNEIK